jgi:hypothetical protein
MSQAPDIPDDLQGIENLLNSHRARRPAPQEHSSRSLEDQQAVRVGRLLSLLGHKAPDLLVLQEMRLITKGVLRRFGHGKVADSLPQFTSEMFREETEG